MFCKKCGKKIPDDSVFCRYCGTDNSFDDVIETPEKEITKKNEDSANNSKEEQPLNTNTAKKKTKKTGFVVLIVLIALLAVFAALSFYYYENMTVYDFDHATWSNNFTPGLVDLYTDSANECYIYQYREEYFLYNRASKQSGELKISNRLTVPYSTFANPRDGFVDFYIKKSADDASDYFRAVFVERTDFVRAIKIIVEIKTGEAFG